MKKGIFEEFEGYREIAQAIEMSRRYGVDYTTNKDAAAQFIDRLHPAKIKFRLSEIITETKSAKTLRLVSESGYLPPFQAGQYISIIVDVDGVRTSRPYSISSSPSQIGHYDVTIARVDGGLVSNYLLDRLAVGDQLNGAGPFGHFYHNPIFHDKTMVCLGGGSGVTPFMSMVREALECGLDRTIYLLHGSRSLEDAIFHDQFMDLSRRYSRFVYQPVFENPPAGWDGPVGYITGELIRGTIGDLDNKTFYLCGPQAMYDFCLPEIGELDVAARKIRREVYGAPHKITETPGWPSDVSADDQYVLRITNGTSFKVRAGVDLLTSLEKAGVRAASQCRSGECSLCRVKLISGSVFQPAESLVRKSDRLHGYVHACVSYPLTDLEIAL